MENVSTVSHGHSGYNVLKMIQRQVKHGMKFLSGSHYMINPILLPKEWSYESLLEFFAEHANYQIVAACA